MSELEQEKQLSHWSGPWSTYEERLADTTKHGPLRIAICKRLAPILDQTGYNWFMESGTLLGAWRNNTMIPHDDDLDLGFLAKLGEDPAEAVDNLYDLIVDELPEGIHCRTVHGYVHKLEFYDPRFGKYHFHNVTVDLTALYLDSSDFNVKHTHYTQEDFTIPVLSLIPIKYMDYEGEQFPAPQDPELYLTTMYGYLGENAVFNNKTNKYKKGT